MDRKQLVPLMPRDKSDVDSARALVALGHPALKPVYPEILRRLKDHDSPVAEIFMEFFASAGETVAPEVGRALMSSRMPELKYKLVSRVLPHWPRQAVEQVASALQMLVTHTDAYDTDLWCIRLLARHQLCDTQWLLQWLDFKRERYERYLKFARELRAELK